MIFQFKLLNAVTRCYDTRESNSNAVTQKNHHLNEFMIKVDICDVIDERETITLASKRGKKHLG